MRQPHLVRLQNYLPNINMKQRFLLATILMCFLASCLKKDDALSEIEQMKIVLSVNVEVKQHCFNFNFWQY